MRKTKITSAYGLDLVNLRESGRAAVSMAIMSVSDTADMLAMYWNSRNYAEVEKDIAFLEGRLSLLRKLLEDERNAK